MVVWFQATFSAIAWQLKCGIRNIIEIIQNLSQYVCAARSYTAASHVPLARASDDHRTTIEAINASGHEEADKLCQEHLRLPWDTYVASLEQRFGPARRL